MYSIDNTPAPRITLVLPIEFRKTYSRRQSSGGLRNISLTGAFLEHTNGDIEINDKINLEFKVSGRKRDLTAQIIWKSSTGAGVRFIPDNNQDLQIIDDLIYFVKNRNESRKTVLHSIFKKLSN